MTSDSGRLPKGENSRSEVECEASQSGGVAASPEHRSSPSIDEELIERLRREDHMPTFTDSLRWALVNPDGPEAADRLESLLSDRAKLEERVEREISAWAFAHDIDGAIRNDLFARLRGLNRSTDR